MNRFSTLKAALLLPISLWGGVALSAQTHLELSHSKGAQCSISFRGTRYPVTLDQSGKGTVLIPDSLPPDYATVFGDRNVFFVYLVPGSEQSVIEHPDRSVKFAGEAEDINRYLNRVTSLTSKINYRTDEKSFMNDWESLGDTLRSLMKSGNFPQRFTDIETRRVHYLTCNLFMTYGFFNGSGLSDSYYRQLEQLLKEDNNAATLSEYLQTFKDGITVLAAKKADTDTPVGRLRYALNYISDNIDDARLADYLVYEFMRDHLRHNGADGIDEFMPLYDKKVTDAQHRASFGKLLERYSPLAAGSAAPRFTLPDADGNSVSLTDFAGKYVYIDVWATWCGPCCRELPHFHKLKDRFKDRPIEFVSISVDQDRDEWIGKLKADKTSGIQLIASGSRFENDYNVTVIPRFILIDKEGRIVNANMTRPSQEETLSILEKIH